MSPFISGSSSGFPTTVNITAFIVESGPSTISGAITTPTDLRSRLLVIGAGALTAVTSITDGDDGSELFIVGTSNANKIKMTALSNLILSGEWDGGLGAVLALQWSPTLSAWIEVGRNEI